MSVLWMAGLFFLACSSPLYAGDLKPYESKAAGLKAQVPAKWERRDNESGFLAMFVPPAEDPNDPYGNFMGFIVRQLTGPAKTLETFTALSEKEVNADVNAKLLLSEPVTLGGRPGHKMGGTTLQGGVRPIQWLQVWTVKDEMAYVCTYIAQKASYPKFLNDFENIVASVTIA